MLKKNSPGIFKPTEEERKAFAKVWAACGAGALVGSPNLNGDPLEIQKKMRDEWAGRDEELHRLFAQKSF